MAKEKTVLMNFRVPESLFNDFKEEVDKDNLVSSRTGMLLILMNQYVNKQKAKRRKNG